MTFSILRLLIAAVCTLFAAAARGDEPPRRASGLWEIKVTVSGQPTASVAQYCIDSQTDDLAVTAGGGVAQKDCSEAVAQHAADGFSIQSVCKLGASTVTTHGVFKGDLQSAYSGEVQAKYSPPLYGRREVKSLIDARMIGPCAR
jgi:hypothetical protein